MSMDKPIGTYNDYQVYKNSDGFLGGYKTIGEKSNPTSLPNADSDRVVTNATTMEDFVTFMIGRNKKKRVKKIKQPKLFDPSTL